MKQLKMISLIYLIRNYSEQLERLRSPWYISYLCVDRDYMHCCVDRDTAQSDYCHRTSHISWLTLIVVCIKLYLVMHTTYHRSITCMPFLYICTQLLSHYVNPLIFTVMYRNLFNFRYYNRDSALTCRNVSNRLYHEPQYVRSPLYLYTHY